MGYFKVSYFVGAVLCWTGPMSKDAADDVASVLVAGNWTGVEVKFFSA